MERIVNGIEKLMGIIPNITTGANIKRAYLVLTALRDIINQRFDAIRAIQTRQVRRTLYQPINTVEIRERHRPTDGEFPVGIRCRGLQTPKQISELLVKSTGVRGVSSVVSNDQWR